MLPFREKSWLENHQWIMSWWLRKTMYGNWPGKKALRLNPQPSSFFCLLLGFHLHERIRRKFKHSLKIYILKISEQAELALVALGASEMLWSSENVKAVWRGEILQKAEGIFLYHSWKAKFCVSVWMPKYLWKSDISDINS